MYTPPDPRRFEEEAKHTIREQERKRDINLARGDPSQSKRLSRRAFVLVQLTIVLLIIVGIVIFLYYLLH